MIAELIKEFALLCDREGVMKSFDKNKTARHPNYILIKEEIKNSTVEPVLPELKGFVFGLNADVVSDVIRNLDNAPFMIVDYGLFRGSGPFNSAAGGDLKFMFSCIIAQPGNDRNLDLFEKMLYENTLLSYGKRLLKHFEQRDAETCAAKRILNDSYSITPIDPVVLFGCIGWDLNFSSNATHFLL